MNTRSMSDMAILIDSMETTLRIMRELIVHIEDIRSTTDRFEELESRVLIIEDIIRSTPQQNVVDTLTAKSETSTSDDTHSDRIEMSILEEYEITPSENTTDKYKHNTPERGSTNRIKLSTSSKIYNIIDINRGLVNTSEDISIPKIGVTPESTSNRVTRNRKRKRT